MAPEVAVTVMMYVPAVVPDVTTLGQATPPPFPLHATTPPTNAMNNSPKLNIDRQVRLRFGMTKRNKLARAAPLPAYHGIPLVIWVDEVQAFEELAVVAIVMMPVPAALPAIVRGLVELKLRVGDAEALLGLVVRAAVRVTLPVKPPIGVTVMVEVLPAVAPAAMLTAVPLIVKSGDAG
jgi:hypothetical protein